MKQGPEFFHRLVQAAGFHDLEEALCALASGVDSLGFPLRLPVNVQDMSEEAAAQVIAALPATAHPVIITYEDEPFRVAAMCRRLGADIVQLHADVSPDALAALRGLAPKLTVIKSVVLRPGLSAAAYDAAMDAASPWADGFILDTYDPSTGASGATGKTHDWSVSRELVRRSSIPVILAGGLTPGNVAAAIQEVRPAGVDAHTGLEYHATGRKDPDAMRAFVQAAQAAWDSLS